MTLFGVCFQIKGTWSKKRNKDTRNPFDQGGLLANFRYILCGPAPPSVIDLRGFVGEDYRLEEVVEDGIQSANGVTYVASTSQMVRLVSLITLVDPFRNAFFFSHKTNMLYIDPLQSTPICFEHAPYLVTLESPTCSPNIGSSQCK